MADTDTTFEHDAAFTPGEVGGNVRLGAFEAQYEELFAEAIEDGVITPDERARLDRAADALGLDRGRLAQLERALEAAYEARYRVRVREAGRDEPEPESEVAPPSTLVSGDDYTKRLERRVMLLEARIVELERELVDAHAHEAVEVDISDTPLPSGRVVVVDDDPDELQRRVRHDPRDAPTLRALLRLYANKGDADRAWCVAHALNYLGQARDDERAIYERGRHEGLIRPTHPLTPEAWRQTLFHPDEEVLTGEIFAVIVSAVLLGRVAALRRDKALPALDPARKQDPAASTLQAVRAFSWSASILGMLVPALYADPAFPGAIEMVPGLPPASRLGKQALSGRSPTELAFAAGRHLSWYREEHFVRLLVPQIVDLEEVFLAALVIGNPAVPLGADRKKRVLPLAKAIEPVLEPIFVDRLRGYFLRFVEEGGRTNLQRWATAADRTAARAGLLLANDLGAAEAMLRLEDLSALDDRMSDLVTFVVGDRYASLRKQLGVALPSGRAA